MPSTSIVSFDTCSSSVCLSFSSSWKTRSWWQLQCIVAVSKHAVETVSNGKLQCKRHNAVLADNLELLGQKLISESQSQYKFQMVWIFTSFFYALLYRAASKISYQWHLTNIKRLLSPRKKLQWRTILTKTSK